MIPEAQAQEFVAPIVMPLSFPLNNRQPTSLTAAVWTAHIKTKTSYTSTSCNCKVSSIPSRKVPGTTGRGMKRAIFIFLQHASPAWREKYFKNSPPYFTTHQLSEGCCYYHYHYYYWLPPLQNWKQWWLFTYRWSITTARIRAKHRLSGIECRHNGALGRGRQWWIKFDLPEACRSDTGAPAWVLQKCKKHTHPHTLIGSKLCCFFVLLCFGVFLLRSGRCQSMPFLLLLFGEIYS